MPVDDETFKAVQQKFESEANARRSIQLELEALQRNSSTQIADLKNQLSEITKAKNALEEKAKNLELSNADLKASISQVKTESNALKGIGRFFVLILTYIL
jgi:hypothetical protein